jgi:predicted Zn finger-like uncharacterized protein
MEITCEHCKTKLNIPDEKIPKNKALRISCPKCKKRMTLDTPKAAPKDSENDKYGYGDYTDDEALTFYEEGTKLALVMDNNPEQSEKIKTAVEQLGYNFISAPNTRDAIGRMRFHHFDLIILSDGFDGQGLENSPVLNYLNNISMSVRRRIFVALVGERFKTMDNMMAFAMSANVVINTKEQDKLSAILKRAISDNEKFYKVFKDTLAEAGKA